MPQGSRSHSVYLGGLIDYIHTLPHSPAQPLTSVAAASLTPLPTRTAVFPASGIPGNLHRTALPISNQNSSTLLDPSRLHRDWGRTFAGLSTQPGNLAVFDTIQFFGAFTKVIGHHTDQDPGPDFRQNKNNVPTRPGSASGSLSASTRPSSASEAPPPVQSL